MCPCKRRLACYICSACHALSCQLCGRLVASPAICVCKQCGGLCSDYGEFLTTRATQADKNAPLAIGDLISALCFPFQDLITNLGLASIYGALLYSVPYLGFSGVGLFFGLLGLPPFLLANTFMIGFNIRVISLVEQGRSDSRNALGTSEMLADLGETVAIAAGVMLVTSTPFLVSILWSEVPALFGWLGIVWFFLYYPLALVVATSTNNFWAIINPLHGVREVQKYPAVYGKLFVFYLLVFGIMCAVVVIAIVMVVRAVSDSPSLGVLPIFILLMTVLGILIFYGNLVMSYMVGRVMFKEIT